jgi:FixJ family two-component response regulator
MIAVIDDDRSVREGLTNLLSSMDYQTRSYASAEAFLAESKLSEPSCLIVDVRMTGMTGIEMQAKARDAGLVAPVIFLTAHCDDNTRERAMSGGAYAFLCKPFDEDELLAVIASALGKAEPI